MLENKKHIHLIGVGGSGMSPLAKVLVEAGYTVSGSDLNLSRTTETLSALGVQVHHGHQAENIAGADLIVISSAVPQDNPELQAARSAGLPVIKRAEVWGELTRRQRSILVAGTHGKTTTTSMIAVLLERAGLDPTFMVGGEVIDLGASARLGKGNYLVAEADEYDGTFLKLSPWSAVLTNVEADHLDYYKNLDAIIDAFSRFADLVPPAGNIIACWDDPRLRAMLEKRSARVIGYGLQPGAEWQAIQVRPNKRGGNDCKIAHHGKKIGSLSLRVAGKHNVANALASIVAGSLVGIDFDRMAAILTDFHGAARRFELKGIERGVEVYDDYAHHPTEIAATLRGARERHPGRIWVVFQPHTYHRTKQHLPEFAQALQLADRVIVTDIYMPAGREIDTLGVSSGDIVRLMRRPGAEHVATLHDATARVLAEVQPGDLVLAMGAGDVYKVALAVLAGLKGAELKGE